MIRPFLSILSSAHKVKFAVTTVLVGLTSLLLALPAFSQDAPSDTVMVSYLGPLKEIARLIVIYTVRYFFQVLGGIVVLTLGWFLALHLSRLSKKYFDSKNIDVTVAKFMASAIRLVVLAFAVVVALGKFGIEIAPFIAGISVVGFGTSFALQGPLSNYASGATLIFTKPFKVGDIIEVAGVTGEVRDIKLSMTELKTVDQERIIIPNKHIIGEIIHNYSALKRGDISLGIAGREDQERALRLIENIVCKDPRVSQKQPPKVGINEFTNFGVNILVRFWCEQDDYWATRFDINRQIVHALNEAGIEMAFVVKSSKPQ